ncbi:hypothetical protein G3O08_03700 [Cryomorpha ignava]|uniref:Uncharacterized protein n=1 Tax=Cryomorpha ignava TaxID=101383 RepID=A0A7K3WM62_9FLAO|nr:hypothetical protein [Cryomorpha ignava]NEN22608.1 hypothetical protein [Cryomorpha ignava]
MKKIVSVILWSLALALCSCSKTVYIASEQHITVIDKKGQTKKNPTENGGEAQFHAPHCVWQSGATLGGER